jgi:hypothetical protein
MGLLSRSRELEQAFFRLAHFTSQAPLSMPSDPMVLKDLRTLSLQTCTSLTDLFIRLVLPSLRFLRVDSRSVDTWSHEAFLSFIKPFSFSLSTLHLEGPPFLEEKLIEYLQLFPSLTQLCLKDRSRVGLIGNGLLRALTYRGKDVSEHLCPNLATLELSGVHACTDEYLVDMVESRWREQPSTQLVSLDLPLIFPYRNG